MDPTTLAAILSGASSIGGLFMQDDPSSQFRKNFSAMSQLVNPQQLNQLAEQFYSQFRRGPAFGNARMNILGSAAQGQRAVNRGFGARGITTSGVGALSGVGQAAGGFKMADLQSQVWMDAINRAMEVMQLRTTGATAIGKPAFGAAQKYGAINDSFGQLLQFLALREQQKQGKQ